MNYIEDSIQKNVKNNITIDNVKGISLCIECSISFCDCDNADVIEWSQRDETFSINHDTSGLCASSKLIAT